MGSRFKNEVVTSGPLQRRARRKDADVELCHAEFTCHAPAATSVSLAGCFNNWDSSANPMTKRGDGSWIVVLRLPPGFYHYKFVVDGKWRCNPELDKDGCDVCGACPTCVPNGFGACDRVMVVA